jgi:hypothetical protein
MHRIFSLAARITIPEIPELIRSNPESPTKKEDVTSMLHLTA